MEVKNFESLKAALPFASGKAEFRYVSPRPSLENM
jgi:hypothetical protein